MRNNPDKLDPFLADLLSKVQGGNIKSDGWVDSHETFTVGHIRLSADQESRLLAFLLKYPETKVKYDVRADGYSHDFRVRKFITPYINYFREASRKELEEALIISGALYKSYRDSESLDEFVMEFQV